MRETLLRGHDGRRYFIPNAKVMTGVIEVETHRDTLRQSLVLRLDPTSDLDAARTAVFDALHQADGVCADPAPDAVLADIVDGEVEMHCRFWTPSLRSAATAARDAALAAVLRELARRRIAFPVEQMHVELRHSSGSDGSGPMPSSERR